MPEQAKKSLVLSIYFALAVSTLLVFWQVRNFDFVKYDDHVYVYENPHVLNGLTEDGVIWAFTTNRSANWHPLTWLSLMLDCQLFGTNPGWIHLINVLLHLANTLLIFAVLKKMTGALWPSAFVAAAFAIHPMHVESVAWIAERKDVLSTFFLLLTLAAYAGYVSRPSVFRYIAALAAFALGLMAKPMLVTLPFVLLLLDYWPLNRLMPQTVAASGRQRRKSVPAADKNPTLYRIIIEKVPFFALSVISSVVTFLVQRSGGAVSNIDIVSLNDRIANVFLSYAEYIGKMVCPQNLAVFYPFSAAGSIPFWQVAMCALLLFGISFFMVRLGRNQRYLLLGWFWFVGTLIPVIGLVQVGGQAYADRYTYIPYIGLFIIIAWGLPELLSKWPQRKIVLGIAAAMVLTAMGIGTYRQVSYWKNSFTLFTHAVEVTPNNWLAYNNLGAEYDDLGRYQDAIESFKQAIRIKLDYAEAHNNLGFAYGKLGRYQDAVEAHKQTIRIKPDLAEAHCNLGNAYGKLGRYQESIEAYKQAIRIKPDFAEAHCNLGVAYGELGRWQDVIEAYKQAIRIKPDFAEAHYNLGVAYGTLGRWQDAVEAYKQAIRIKPDYAEAHCNLGVAYGELGRWQDAIEAYKQAIRIKPDYAEAHCNLGVTYLGTGDKGSALEEYKILKTLDTKLANKLFNLIYE
jgi:tetratricopeptide (TPR) repeat protein